MTRNVQLVLHALLTTREMYGLEIMRVTGMKSGTIYPVLARLEAAGWITSRTEDIDPHTAQRPARRYYQITGTGAGQARDALARDVLARAAFTAFGGPSEDKAVHEAEQAILDLAAAHTDLVKSSEFTDVLRGLYRAGALGT